MHVYMHMYIYIYPSSAGLRGRAHELGPRAAGRRALPADLYL